MPKTMDFVKLNLIRATTTALSDEAWDVMRGFAYGVDGEVDGGFSWIVKTSYIEGFIKDVDEGGFDEMSQRVAEELRPLLPQLVHPFTFFAAMGEEQELEESCGTIEGVEPRALVGCARMDAVQVPYYDVVLRESGSYKLRLAVAVREIMGVTLGEVKDIVDRVGRHGAHLDLEERFAAIEAGEDLGEPYAHTLAKNVGEEEAGAIVLKISAAGGLAEAVLRDTREEFAIVQLDPHTQEPL